MQTPFFILLIFMSLLGGCDNRPSIGKDPKSASCEHNRPCAYGEAVQISLFPQTIKPEQEFSIFAVFPPGVEPTLAYIEGDSMYMGRIPVFFAFHSERKGYLANTMVGACTDEQMRWRLVVNSSDGQQYTYYFHSYNNV